MFQSCRPLLIAGLLIAAPGGAQLLGGLPLGNAQQTVQQVGQVAGQTVGAVGPLVQGVEGTVGEVGETAGRTVAGLGRSVGGIVSGLHTALLPAGAVERLVAPGAGLSSVLAPVGRATTDRGALLELRAMRHQALVIAHPAELEIGDDGAPIRRGQLLLTNATLEQIDAAAELGFAVRSTERDEALGLTLSSLDVPRDVPARKALRQLLDAVPGIPADVDPLFEPAGGALVPVAAMALAGGGTAGRGQLRIVMIDGGVAAHPSMALATIEQKGFAGRAVATGHGTAVASLLVGNQSPFRGAARGTSLYVADVYGGDPAAGSASAIVRALGWAASKRPQVVTLSLVGPPNLAVERAIAGLLRMGIKLVAAVGNDGPAAPPAYPASYRGVLSVTGVDERNRALPEAGRPRHLDFAAPGSAMAAALPGKGYANVRGTSFAAPLAAARLLEAGSVEALADEAVPGKGRVGRGVVCGPCRTAPATVGAK